MPEGKRSGLIGVASKKAKKRQKLLNFPKNTGIIPIITSDVSNTSLAETNNDIAQSNASVSVKNAVSNSVENFVEGVPQENIGTVSREGSPFLGFSPLVNNLTKVESRADKCQWLSDGRLTQTLKFPPQNDLMRKRKSCDRGLDRMTSTLRKRHSIEFSRDVRDLNVVEAEKNASVNISVSGISVNVRSGQFFKIVLGDVCQFSPIFPYPQHQCTAMAATALAYNIIKAIDEWDANDLNDILRSGQKYYEETILNLRIIAPEEKSTFIDATSLNENLYIASQIIEVAFDGTECRGGDDTREDMVAVFRNFEEKNFTNGILTYLDYSWALLRHRDITDHTYIYVFFDSHGRRENGTKVEPDGRVVGKAAILFFKTANDFIDFFLREWGRLTPSENVPPRNFILVPLHFTTIGNRSILPNRPEINASKSDDEKGFHIVCGDYSEYDVLPAPHGQHQCSGIVIFSFIYSTLHSVLLWDAKNLSDIVDFGNMLYHKMYHGQIANNSQYDTKSTLSPRQFSNEYVTYCGYDYKIHVSDVDCPGRINKEHFSTAFQYLANLNIPFGIFVINGMSYGLFICRMKNTTTYIFLDSHGRTNVGVANGPYSAVLYFNAIENIINFLYESYCGTGGFILYPVQLSRESAELNQKIGTTNAITSVGTDIDTIEAAKDKSTIGQNLFTRVITGTFAQDDIRFNVLSRNTQCTANSVVFLAYSSVIKDKWTCNDIDAILTLGDQIYSLSFREALKRGPRLNTFLAAHEILENISVNINRFNRGIVNVCCQAITQKEYSGNFGKFGELHIAKFFQKYNNGVFISCALSVALHKFNGEYIVFDPHARTAEDLTEEVGRATSFFFSDISSLYKFLCRCGYRASSEFTLSPFNVTEIAKPKQRGKVVDSRNEAIDPDISQDLSVKSFRSLPRRKSTPMVADNRTKAERYKDRTRNRRSNGKAKDLLRPEYEKEVRRRWRNYCQKVRRTQTANIFGDLKNYKEFYDAHMAEADSDEEMVEAAHKTVKTFLDEEHRRQMHMLKNAMIPTHFHAFGNHEDIDEKNEMYTEYELSPMNEICPHCGALYFKEECNSSKVFRTCCNFGEIHSDLPEQQSRNYPPFLRDLLLGKSPLSREFLNNIMYYNNVLSFASLGTTTIHYKEARGSLGPVVAMEGMIYHIAEHFHTNSTGIDMPTAQLYYIDNKVAAEERMSRAGRSLNISLMMWLENFMRVNNPLTGAYRMLKEVLSEVNRRRNGAKVDVHLQIVRNRDAIKIRQNHGGDFGMAQNNEVAAIYTHLPSSATKNIVVFPVNQPAESGIALASHEPNRDAMMYPILFPFAEQTWTYTLMRRKRPAKADAEEEVEEEQDVDCWEDARNMSEDESEQEEGQPWRDPPPWEQERVHDSESEEDEQEEGQPWRDPPPWEQEKERASESEEETEESEEDNTRWKKPRKRITVREFFCYLLMLRMAFSPLLNAGKLGQQFIIDCYARAQDNHFEYLETEKGQAQIRSETYGALKDYLDRKKMFQGNLPGKLIVMPNTIIGSRQYMKRRYSDALAIVAKFGKPTFFITMTCNPQWVDIKRNIPKNANAIDQPGIVARIFKAKVKEFIDDIYKNHVMGRCVAYVAVIEWQKRSLPHCHLVSFNSPEDRPSTPADVDSFVSAEIPDPQKNPRLYEAVTKYMFHHRCDHNRTPRESCMVPRQGNFKCPRHPKFGEEEDEDQTKKCICYKCSKNFPRKFADNTELRDGGYPIYRRRQNGRKFISSRGDEIDNAWIVPYNPYLLLKYNCHINVEITASLKSIKYLFKYLHKGLDMARLQVKLIDNVEVYNEFDHFVDCRYLSAGEAIWKLYDFPMFYQSHTIYGLPVHLENYQNVIFNPDRPLAAMNHSESHLTAYFDLNRTDPEARQYLYTEIPLHYVYDKKTQKWHPRVRRQGETLARLYTVNYNKIELYSLRLLLLTVKGAQSFEDIRKVNDIQYDTFAQAAGALGLLEDDSLRIESFKEIIDVEMPYRIRCLFVTMLLFYTPSDAPSIWTTFKKKMSEDYVRKGCEEIFAENLALRHISFLLVANGRNNADFKLPEPSFKDDELQEAQTITTSFDTHIIDQANEGIEGRRLAQLLTDEQRCIFDEIMDSVQNPDDPNKQQFFFVDGDKHRLFFVDGPGGTGKTFLFATFISVLRGMGLSVLPIAWTGIAAALLKGGRTVHSVFKLPFDFSGPVSCNLSTYSDMAEELRKATVIVWDEISMTPCHAIDAVDKFFRDLMGIDVPFGGKVFVATGDFRQILPIVRGGSKYDLLNVTVKKSKVWPLLKHCSLSKNVRLTDPNDIAFAQWLLDVGEDKINDLPGNKYYNSFVKIPSECIEPISIIDRIYGKSFSSADIDTYSKYAILTTLNEDVDFLNDEIYKRLTENVSTEHTYYSSDRVVGLDPNDDDAYDVSMLNTLKPARLPPHELKLKEHCIVMLLCNLNPAQGLCNGTRLIITKLYRTCIRAKILHGDFKGEEVLISRCRIESDSMDTSCKFERVQIPVKLAFAMTINKAQGQTIDYVGIYLRKAPFAHGQLYVALSRARSKDRLIIQVLPDTHMGKLIPGCDDVFVPNIVYKEIF